MDDFAQFQSPRTDEPLGGLDWAQMQSPLSERDVKRTTREISGPSAELYPGAYSGREIDWRTYARQGGRPEESGLEQVNAPPSSGALSIGGVVDFPSVQVPEAVSEGALRLGGQVAGDVLSGPLGAMGGGMLAEESIANIDRLTGRTPQDPLLRASQGAMGGLETSLIGRGYGLAGKAGGALAPTGLKGAGSLLAEGGAIAGHGLYESGRLTPETAAMATLGPIATRGAGALGRKFSQVREAAETRPAGGGEGLSHPRIPPEPSSPGGERPPLFKEPAPREGKAAEYHPPEVARARQRFEEAMEIPEDLKPRSVGEEYRAMKESGEQFPGAGGFSEGGKYRPEIRGGAPKEPPEFTARKVDEGGTEWTVAHADRSELYKAGILKDRGPGMVKTEAENPGWYVYKREPGGEWQIVRDAGRATQEGAAIKLMGDAMGLEAPRAPGRPRSESERQLSKEDAETTRRAKEIFEELKQKSEAGEPRKITLPGEPPKPNPELEPVGKYPPPLEEQLKPTAKPPKKPKRVKLPEAKPQAPATWEEYEAESLRLLKTRRDPNASEIEKNRARGRERELYKANPEFGERFIAKHEQQGLEALKGTEFEKPPYKLASQAAEAPAKTPEEELAEAFKAKGLKPVDPEKYGREADKILGRGTPEAFEKLESTREERPSLPRAGEKPPKPPRSPVGKEPVQPGEEGFTKGHRKGLESAREMRKAGEKSPVPGHELRAYSTAEEVKATVEGFKGKIFSAKFPKNPKKVGDPSEWREMHGTTRPPHDYEFKTEPGSREEVKQKHKLITIFETDEAGSYLRDEEGNYKVRTLQHDKPVTIRGPGGVQIQYTPPAKKVVLPEPPAAVPEELPRERETSSRISETLSLELPEPEPRRAPKATYELPLGKPLEPRQRKKLEDLFPTQRAPAAEFELPKRPGQEPHKPPTRPERKLPEQVTREGPAEGERIPVTQREHVGVRAIRKTTRKAAAALKTAGEALEFPVKAIDKLTDQLLGKTGGVGARGLWRILSAVGLAGPATNVGRGLIGAQFGGKGLQALGKKLSRFSHDPDLPEKIRRVAQLGDDLPPGEVAARAVIAHWISQHAGK